MKQLYIFLVINLCVFKITIAQKEYNNWFFGSRSALNFGTGSPVFVPGSNLVSQEGSSSISDKQGNLLFYSNGVTVWDRNHNVMPNGAGLNGDIGSTQTVLITNHPGNNYLYYIFTVAKEGDPKGFQYSVVNMNLNGGLGDVDVSLGKNVSFNLPVCEKIVAVKHRNLNDIWIVMKVYNSDQFIEYLIDCSGFITYPQASYYIGSKISTPLNAGGYLKASPDGKKLAMANFEGNVELFDFDNATGLISNAQTIPANPGFSCGPYGVEFSPDSKLLYSSQAYTCNGGNTYEISQYNLDAGNIPASKVTLDAGSANVAGALQLGPDNKIYIAYNQAAFLGTVNNPNVYGPGCGFVKQNVSLPAPALSMLGLPNIAASYNKTLLGEDTSICEGTSKVIKLNIPNTTYLWSNGAMIDSIVITTSGQYWVQITHGACVYRDTVNITVQQSPVFSLNNDTAICQNKFPYVLKKFIPGATYLWQDGSTDSTFPVSQPGLYWMQATVNGCSTRDSAIVSVQPVDTFSLGNDSIICGSKPLSLTVAPSYAKYLWSTGSTSSSISVNTTGIYWCEATNSSGCSYRDSIRVTFNKAPVVNLGNDTTLCQDKFPYLLKTSVPGASYLWQDGSTDSSINVLGGGTYWVQATLNGCSARDSVLFVANPVTTFNLGADSIICGNQPLTLTVTPAFATYLWSTGSTSKSISVNNTGIYWCEATNSSGCSFRDTINLAFNPSSIVNLGKDTFLCQDKLPLVIGQNISNTSYLWQDGSTNAFFTVNGPGLYWVQATINSCSTRDSITISVGSVPVFKLGSDSVICGNQPLTLTVTPAFATYLWSNGSTSRSISVNSTGLYWSQATNSSGCSYRDSIQLTFKPSPVVNLGNDITLCQDKFPLLLKTSVQGAAYLWQDGSTDSSISVLGGGLYWVQATLNGCSARDSVSIVSNPVTTFYLGADSIICGTQSLTLTVTPPFAKYLWNTGSTSRSITVNSTGIYWCEATNSSGCSYRDSISLAFNPSSIVNLGKDTTLCQGSLPLVIGQNISNASYLWQDGSTNAFYTVTGPGIYWVQATVNGCSARDSITVSVGSITTFNLGADSIICGNQSRTLTVTPAFTRYLWNTGSTSRSITVSSSGVYWCEATNSSGCSYRDSISLAFNAASIINLGNDSTLCPGGFPLVIGKNISNASYLWQDGSTNPFYNVNGPGLYWVQATVNGCSARDSISISAGAVTPFSLGADTSGCANQAITLGISQSFTKYLWNTGSATKNISVSNSGDYWLEATNSFGCSYRDTIRVNFKPAPVVNLGSDISLCQNKLPLQIGQTIPGASYLWQDGSTNAFFSVPGPGLYWMQANLNGCSARDSITVSSGNATPFNLGADTIICNAQTLQLGVSASFIQYLWNTGSVSKNISVSVSGDYWLEAVNNSGCSYRDSIHVDFISPPSFSLGPDTLVCNSPAYLLDVSNAGDKYLWQDNSTQSRYLVNKTGSYHVLVSKNGCSIADTVSIIFKSRPEPDLGIDKNICPGDVLLLNPSVAGTAFKWQDGSREPTYKAIAPGRYTVAVTNECGTGSDEVTVSIGSCKLLVPNAFTPEKTVNNIFRLTNAAGLKDFRLQVFNRWGQQLYQTSNSSEGWNGKYKGIDQPSGMYVYIISYSDVSAGTITQKGTVILIR